MKVKARHVLLKARHVLPSVLAALLAALLAATLPPGAAAQLVADLARPDAAVRIGSGAAAAIVAPPDGDGFAPVRFMPAAGGAAPALTLRPAAGSWDWQAARGLRLHLQNAMPWPVTVMLQLEDRAGGKLDATLGLPPGGPLTLTLPLAPTQPKRWGMVAGPPVPWTRDGGPAAVALAVAGRIDPAAIAALRIAIPAPDSEQRLRIGKIFLAGADDDERQAYTAIVDAWGQYARGRWPGKYDPAAGPFDAFAAAQDRETAAAVGAAVAAIDRGAPPPSLDRFGGVIAAPASASAGAVKPMPPAATTAAAPTAAATGFFRTTRARLADGSNRWLLVTPLGNPFFSLGVNAIQRSNSQTFTEGREFMFAPLPPAGDPLARFAGRQDSRDTLPASAGAQQGRGFGHGATFDFYRANLQRRDGDAATSRWLARTRERLRDWHFNTIGSWSDAALDAPTTAQRLPYTRTIHVAGDFARLSDGHDWWAGIPDPFDPRFAAALERAVVAEAGPRRDDPYLIGYFVDNELGWGDGGAADPKRRLALALAVLAMDGRAPQSHAKRALVALLRERHRDDARALAASWGTTAADWATLEGAIAASALPDPSRPAVADDLGAFLALHADRYFSQVAGTLKRQAPNHLYLGARFASRTPQALAACARWCDVVSFNLYLPSLDVGFETAAFRQLGKPALLTEFHFGSSDRGPFWPGVMPVAADADRGPAYRRMIESVLANPDFVGAHWFQYLDQPVTGRWLDGENGHLGLVAITDAPWPALVAAAAAAHRTVQHRLAGARLAGKP
ncbi:MAG: hypothetical protein AB7G13_30160 [Lautropia sp.]